MPERFVVFPARRRYFDLHPGIAITTCSAAARTCAQTFSPLTRRRLISASATEPWRNGAGALYPRNVVSMLSIGLIAMGATPEESLSTQRGFDAQHAINAFAPHGD